MKRLLCVVAVVVVGVLMVGCGDNGDSATHYQCTKDCEAKHRKCLSDAGNDNIWINGCNSGLSQCHGSCNSRYGAVLGSICGNN